MFCLAFLAHFCCSIATICEDHCNLASRLNFQLFSPCFKVQEWPVVCSHAWPLNAHAINYENIGQTLLRRTRPSILERTLPPATCIKFKVFTAIFSLHFTEIVFCLFARTFTLPCTVSSTNSQEQATHTHTHIVTPIVENVLYVFELSRVSFGLEASWPLHLLRLVQLLRLPHFMLLWRLLSLSFFHCFSFHTLQMSIWSLTGRF